MVVRSIRAVYFDDALFYLVSIKVAIDCHDGTPFSICEGCNTWVFCALPKVWVDTMAEGTSPMIKLASGSVIDSSSSSRSFVEATGRLQDYLTEVQGIFHLRFR